MNKILFLLLIIISASLFSCSKTDEPTVNTLTKNDITLNAMVANSPTFYLTSSYTAPKDFVSTTINMLIYSKLSPEEVYQSYPTLQNNLYYFDFKYIWQVDAYYTQTGLHYHGSSDTWSYPVNHGAEITLPNHSLSRFIDLVQNGNVPLRPYKSEEYVRNEGYITHTFTLVSYSLIIMHGQENWLDNYK